MRSVFTEAPLAAVLWLAALSDAGATRIDIRDCPLDTVVFVDPWTGGSFAVSRVATDYFQICEEGTEPPHESCSDPYGDLILEGTYRKTEGSAPQAATAIWSVIKAAPCCGWNVETGPAAEIGENFKWLAEAEAPRLREMPWLSIESEYGSAFDTPLHAAACTMR